MNPSRLLTQKNGSAMVNAILLSTIVVITSGVIFQQSLESQRLNKYPRIKSKEIIAETTVRTWALQPGSYSNCGTGDPSCNINASLIEGKRFIVRGAQCPPTVSPCGFVVENVSFDNLTQMFRAFLRYEGTEVSLKRKEILMKIPPETLHSDVVTCGASTPIFEGLNDDGTARCRALPPQSQCSPGEYATATDLGQLSVTCQPIAINNPTCGPGQLISSIQWNAGAFDVTCEPRTPAFTFAQNLSGFTPSVTATGAATVSGPIVTPRADDPRPEDYYVYNGCCTPVVPACAPGVPETSSGMVSDGCGTSVSLPGCGVACTPITCRAGAPSNITANVDNGCGTIVSLPGCDAPSCIPTGMQTTTRVTGTWPDDTRCEDIWSPSREEDAACCSGFSTCAGAGQQYGGSGCPCLCD